MKSNKLATILLTGLTPVIFAASVVTSLDVQKAKADFASTSSSKVFVKDTSKTKLKCSKFNINSEIRVSDGNKKVLKTNGEFWVNGNKLGVGQWISPTRYVVFVKNWGNIWWVGELNSEGMLSTAVPTKSELLSAKPENLERFTPADEFAVNGNLLISEGSHGKVIKPNGDFIVNGTLHGNGRWVTSTRFVVFVERWGNVWWVGELNSEGMLSSSTKSEAEALSLKPSNQELWTKSIKFSRQANILVSDGNRKEIKSNGDFWVNGNKLGNGRWVSPSRYVVFVEAWGNRWWIGNLTSEGMLSTTVVSPTDIATAEPSNLESYAFPSNKGIWCAK